MSPTADFNLGTARGTIELDSSGVEKGIDKAKKEVGGFTGAVEKMPPVAKAAAAGISAALFSTLGYGVKIAKDTEQATIAFQQFLGSGEKAQAFTKDLFAFAAKTPFEFPGLRDAAVKLLGVGVAGENIIPILRGVGDSAAAVGVGTEGVERITRALTQTIGKGKVQTEELMQIAETGVPIFDLLAKSLGVNREELDGLVRGGLAYLELGPSHSRHHRPHQATTSTRQGHDDPPSARTTARDHPMYWVS